MLTGKIVSSQQGQADVFTEKLGNNVSLEMVSIKGGTFLMGSPDTEKERTSSESPQHWVTLQRFFLGKYPVTQAQWQAVMGNNPAYFKGNNRPVENVSWNDAIAFCQKLSQKTGRYYRLPSEAEWEYACRAGTTTPFYFGETITPDLANYDGNYTYASAPKGVYRQQTTDVGSFPPNAFGLYDMHGNVWEWCQDIWHENYNGRLLMAVRGKVAEIAIAGCSVGVLGSPSPVAAVVRFVAGSCRTAGATASGFGWLSIRRGLFNPFLFYSFTLFLAFDFTGN